MFIPYQVAMAFTAVSLITSIPLTARAADSEKGALAVLAYCISDLERRDAASTDQQDVDVTGIWTFDVETSAGSGTPTMTFKQEGTKLTGTYEGQLGKAPLAGTVEGRKIQFTFTVDVQGQAVEIGYQGSIDSDTTMKGTVQMAGGAVTGSFTAKKKT